MMEFGLGFFIKKLLGALLMPLSIVFLLFLASFILKVLNKLKPSKWAFGSAIFALFLFSHPFFAYLLAHPLEEQYPKYADQPVDYVIVLGGYHSSDPRKPISSLLSTTSLMRLTEGIRIQGLNKGSKLLLSGYSLGDDLSNALAMSLVAQSVGVDPEDIVIAEEPKDTGEEAKHWSSFIGQISGEVEPSVALVTSASHMPRAVRLFTQQNLSPIFAPTNFRSEKPSLTYWKDWLPSAHALDLTTTVWHEYIGLVWTEIRDW